MSLLDFLNSDDARLGIGLLSASGPQTDPTKTGLGAILSSAMADVDARKKAALQNTYLQAQISDTAAQAASRGAIANAMGDIFSPGSTPASTPQPGRTIAPGLLGAPLPTAGGVPPDGSAPAAPTVPTVPTAAATATAPGVPAAAPSGSLKGVPIGKIERLKAAGGPDLTDQWKLENIGTPIQPGYVKFADGSTKYIGDPAKGLTLDANGNVTLMPGALQAQGAQAEQQELLKRYYAVPPTTLNAQGQPSYQQLPLPPALYLGGGQGGAPGAAPAAGGQLPGGGSFGAPRPPINAPAAGVAPGLPTPAPCIQAGSFMPGSNGKVDVDRAMAGISMIGNPQDRANALQSLQMQVAAEGAGPGAAAAPSAGPGVQDLSAQQKADIEVAKAKQIEQNKTDIGLQDANDKMVSSGMAAINTTNDLLAHPGLSKSTGMQGVIDPRNLAPGSDGADFQARLAQAKAQAFSAGMNAIRGSGLRITQGEVMQAQNAIARMQTSQSTPEFENAMKDFRASMANAVTKAGGTIPDGTDVSPGSRPGSTGGAGGPVVPTTPGMTQQIVSTLPPANSVAKGSIITDHATGKRQMSDGLKWNALN